MIQMEHDEVTLEREPMSNLRERAALTHDEIQAEWSEVNSRRGVDNKIISYLMAVAAVQNLNTIRVVLEELKPLVEVGVELVTTIANGEYDGQTFKAFKAALAHYADLKAELED